MKLGAEQVRVCEALELNTQPFPKRALSAAKLKRLIEAIPAIAKIQPAISKPRRRVIPSGATLADGPADPFDARLKSKVFLFASRASASELRTLLNVIKSLHSIRKDAEWGQDTPEIGTAIALLERACTRLGMRVGIHAESHRGKPIDERRRLILIALARQFRKINTAPTTTPDGAYCVAACALLGVSSIPHNDLKAAITASRLSD